MRLHAVIFAVLAVTVAGHYYNGAFCNSSLDCLRICQQGDFKVVQDSDGRPQLACAGGIIELLAAACAQARGVLCVNYCVVPTRDPGRFEDQCQGLQGMPSTMMGGLTEDQAKGQESCSWPTETG
ncbi:hypothetical protein LLEC1_06891 [Akanthomyces lecanii]|uniref:Extracellular membrane protein CFEM domain-containing protein n=1 Tax=Cordyceps confragosa TaxID=2714763 RepID=A0A179I9F4_CORDF|nr:hypothetical protein LLEC1_06891 [Akanthomyces lecanii]